MFVFSMPEEVSVNTKNVNATSFLTMCLLEPSARGGAISLLSMWIPPNNRSKDDPLLPLSFFVLLQTITTATTDDVQVLRLLLEKGLDINYTITPTSPITLMGFNYGNASLLYHLATKRSPALLSVALEPNYCAVVDKRDDRQGGTALSEATRLCCVPAMDLLLSAGADATLHVLRPGDPEPRPIVYLAAYHLGNSRNLPPDLQAMHANGGGAAALAKVLHRGNVPEEQVTRALGAARKWPNKAALEMLEKHRSGLPFCCAVCGSVSRSVSRSVSQNSSLLPPSSVGLLSCPCGTVAYCCKDHQVLAWKGHKAACGGAGEGGGKGRGKEKEKEKGGRRKKGGGRR